MPLYSWLTCTGNMKCAVAIVLALIGLAVANPVAPIGLGLASPLLVPSPVSVSANYINHGYGKVVAPVVAPYISPVTVPVVKSVPIIKTPVLTAPLSIGYPGVGYGYGWGGYDLGKGIDLGYGGLGYGGLGYGGYGGWGYGAGKGWH